MKLVLNKWVNVQISEVLNLLYIYFLCLNSWTRIIGHARLYTRFTLFYDLSLRNYNENSEVYLATVFCVNLVSVSIIRFISNYTIYMWLNILEFFLIINVFKPDGFLHCAKIYSVILENVFIDFIFLMFDHLRTNLNAICDTVYWAIKLIHLWAYVHWFRTLKTPCAIVMNWDFVVVLR